MLPHNLNLLRPAHLGRSYFDEVIPCCQARNINHGSSPSGQYQLTEHIKDSHSFHRAFYVQLSACRDGIRTTSRAGST